jgi:ribonuclease-3 family protein
MEKSIDNEDIVSENTSTVSEEIVSENASTVSEDIVIENASTVSEEIVNENTSTVSEDIITGKGSFTLDLNQFIENVFELEKVEPNSYSPLVLAYIGDSVYDLIIKYMVISEGNRQVQKLHDDTSKLVQANAQSLMMRSIQEHLTELEHGIYRRGRNSKTITPAKNQSITDYRRATGFEALIGYLYLNKEIERVLELVKIGLEYLEGESKG